ncbi:MAG: hypothetical protein WC164_02140 [Patescibacteria group bacterium]|nr:hypothetical protein [Patescibacteria group bacterium]
MKKINILIVEDDCIQADMLAIIFKNFFSKYKKVNNVQSDIVASNVSLNDCLSIDFAIDSKEAELKISKSDYFLITLDGVLYGGDHGRNLLRLMNFQQIKKTMIISGDIEFITECEKKGMVCIEKPVSAGSLEKSLKIFLS